MIKLIWIIFVVMYFYIFVAINVFSFFAKRDYFLEFISTRNTVCPSFPKKTFLGSVFWIIAIPILCIKKIIDLIEEKVICSYCEIYNEQKKREEKISEEE